MLTVAQKNNSNLLIEELKKKGITNVYAISAILAVLQKETELDPTKAETGYSRTSNDRIKQIFGKTSVLDDAQLNKLKSSDITFFNYVYNGVGGNGPLDGHKYRGRGYNQITGKNNYLAIGKAIGVDLLNKPELLQQPNIAAKAAVYFFETGFKQLKAAGNAQQYRANSLNEFANLNDALMCIYHINAGVGRSAKYILADVTGGLAKAKNYVQTAYNYVASNPGVVVTSFTGLLFFWV